MTSIETITELLRIKGISPAKMMKSLGFSSGLYTQWKQGKQNPSLTKLCKIAEFLEVPSSLLVDPDDSIVPNTLVDYITKKYDTGFAETSNLSEYPEDKQLISEFRQLDEAQKQNVMSYIKFLQSQPKTNADIIREAQRNTQENLDRIEALRKEAESIKKELQEKMNVLSDI